MKYDRIQCLRFAGAASVVLFHALGTAKHYFEGRSLLQFARHGDLGVDLFFVISGFIMVLTVQSRERDWRLFLSRRIERIVPLYWVATAAMVAMLTIPGISSTPPADTEYIVRSFLFISWTENRLPVIYPGWTVEYEMIFYMTIVVAMALTRHTWTTTILVVAALASGGALSRFTGTNLGHFEFVTNAMLLEFAMGILIGHIVLGIRLPRIGLAALLLALAIVIVAPWDEYAWRAIVIGVPSALVVYGATVLDRANRLKSAVSKIFIKLGDASYAIYLFQVFTISIGCKFMQNVWPGAPVDVVIVTCFVGSIAAAYFAHLLVERPLGRVLRRLEVHRLPPKTTGTATGL